MKKILIINGHPKSDSFNYALHTAYKNGVISSASCVIDEIKVGELDFNPNLFNGYSSGTTMEPDLIKAQDQIMQADHIVWIYPQWWGMMPAILKGFIDRVFVPGFAFKYHSTGIKWDKLLKGKTTEIICTLDYPVLIFKLFFNEGGVKVMRKMILDFCGLKISKTTYIGPVRTSSAKEREKWIKLVGNLGSNLK